MEDETAEGGESDLGLYHDGSIIGFSGKSSLNKQ